MLLPVLLLAACGGGSSSSTTTGASGLDFATASAKTIDTGSARFTLLVGAIVAGSPVQSSETGTISFSRRRAHVYKLIPAAACGRS